VEGEYWTFLNNLVRNKSYNLLFEMPASKEDHLYVLNSNNEAFTNNSWNPYFGELTLMKAAQRPYLKTRE